MSKFVNNMNIEKFPETLQPQANVIKSYVDDIGAQLKSLDNVVTELLKKVSLSVHQSVARSLARSLTQIVEKQS